MGTGWINYMGLVDENNKVNFYNGRVRIVDTDGIEIGKYSPSEYLEYVSEHVEYWSYLKFLQEQGSIPPEVKLIEAGIPGLSLVEMMLGAKRVIMVDSFLGGGNPGIIRRFTEKELPPVEAAVDQAAETVRAEVLRCMKSL